MPSVRVALAGLATSCPSPYDDPLLLVRLEVDQMACLTAKFADRVRRHLGGVRVVLVGRDAMGDLQTWGDAGTTLDVVFLDLDALTWTTYSLGAAEVEGLLDLAA